MTGASARDGCAGVGLHKQAPIAPPSVLAIGQENIQVSPSILFWADLPVKYWGPVSKENRTGFLQDDYICMASSILSLIQLSSVTPTKQTLTFQ